MTRVDKVAVLSTALSALSVKDAYANEAEKVAKLLADTCEKLAGEDEKN